MSDSSGLERAPIDSRRGVLYPDQLPTFHRLSPGRASDLVEWFWIPEWEIPTGEVSAQELLPYPALNLVVEGNAVTLHGASTRRTTRELRGHGWAVGALLRPAAVGALTDTPADLIDTQISLDESELASAISTQMATGDGYRQRAANAFADWLLTRAGQIGPAGEQANAMAKTLVGPDAASSVDAAAAQLAVSLRTLQRLAHRYVGLTPSAMLRRRRLQEAADRVRTDPKLELADLAAHLGYADHAHLTRDFVAVLGFNPSSYRCDPDLRSRLRQGRISGAT